MKDSKATKNREHIATGIKKNMEFLNFFRGPFWLLWNQIKTGNAKTRSGYTGLKTTCNGEVKSFQKEEGRFLTEMPAIYNCRTKKL